MLQPYHIICNFASIIKSGLTLIFATFLKQHERISKSFKSDHMCLVYSNITIDILPIIPQKLGHSVKHNKPAIIWVSFLKKMLNWKQHKVEIFSVSPHWLYKLILNLMPATQVKVRTGANDLESCGTFQKICVMVSCLGKAQSFSKQGWGKFNHFLKPLIVHYKGYY